MAVQYIHGQKILHRDIKSQNVFLTKGGIAKLGKYIMHIMFKGDLSRSWLYWVKSQIFYYHFFFNHTGYRENRKKF